MKVLLLNPPLIFKKTNSRIRPIIENLFYNSPPLGLGYLAAVLQQNKISVQIIDAAVERLKEYDILRRINEFQPDILGVTSTTNYFHSALSLSERVKKILPGLIIAIGGPHVSAQPIETLRHRWFDFGVIGEGEYTFLEAVNCINEGKDICNIKGVVYRNGSDVLINEPRPLIKELDILPLPARNLLPIRQYRPQPNDQFLLPKSSMISSRGCPYKCIFCDKNVFGTSYRSFSPAYIVSEMQHLIKDYGARDIAFLDSTFTYSVARVRGIIEEIKKRKIDVKWTCTVRANVVNKELLGEMKAAGCWRVRIGVESGNEEVLKFIKKGVTKQQVTNTVQWAHALGMQPKGFFMVGHLIDTRETIKETIEFAKSLPLKDITVQINSPLPNTSQYKIYREYGKLETEDYRKFSFWQPVFIPAGLKKEELSRAHKSFYRSFYLRPAIFWRHIFAVRHWYNLIKYLKSIALILNLFFNITTQPKRND